MKTIIYFSVFVFSAFSLYFLLQFSDGSYPEIYNEKNSRYKYSMLNVDGNIVIYSVDSSDSHGIKNTLVEHVYPSLSQSCDYVVGYYNDNKSEGKNPKYFIINKIKNEVNYSLNKNEVYGLYAKKYIDISPDEDNTRYYFDRKKIYSLCDSRLINR